MRNITTCALEVDAQTFTAAYTRRISVVVSLPIVFFRLHGTMPMASGSLGMKTVRDHAALLNGNTSREMTVYYIQLILHATICDCIVLQTTSYCTNDCIRPYTTICDSILLYTTHNLLHTIEQTIHNYVRPCRTHATTYDCILLYMTAVQVE